MLKNRIVPLVFALMPLHLAAEPMTLSVQVTDSKTSEPVTDARVIVKNGPVAKPSRAEMAQKSRQFQPQVLVVPKGSKVNFPNLDNTQHHVYSFSPAKPFNLELFADQPEAPVTFDKTGVVEVGCNIHDQMQGFIVVTDSALTASTDEAGMASLTLPDNMSPENGLSVSVWHPRLKNVSQTADFTVGMTPGDAVELAVDLAPERQKASRLDGLQKRFRDL